LAERTGRARIYDEGTGFMNDPSGGLLARLRENERLRKLSGGRPELIIFGAPVAAIIIIAAVAVAVAMSGGGSGGDSQAKGKTPTDPAGTLTTAAGSPTAGASAGLKTPIVVSPGDLLTPADLAARGRGTPGRGEFGGTHLVIPKIGVDAPFTVKEVGTDGQMPNPNGPEDVAYYDFAQWNDLGGTPGKGGNVVLAGHVDYIRYGPAVFWRLHELEVGDTIEIQMADGTSATYKVEFNKQIDASAADWTPIVEATADESITLITCGGEFSAGHYNNRQIIWGRRV
jgi:LPXTG-site transpeptidase (sortase) family protein